MLDHELQNSRELCFRANIDERWLHDIGNDCAHEIVVMRHYLRRRKGKALQKIQLGHQPNSVGALDNRISIEVVAFEQQQKMTSKGI